MTHFMKQLLVLFLSFPMIHSCSGTIEYKVVEPITTTIHKGQTENYSDTKNAYFGDTHIHTSWSFDAFISNVRTTPDDAYNYGKGAAIAHVSGTPIQLERPLDFMAVSDHAEYMGAMMQMLDKDHPIASLDISEKISDPDPDVSLKAVKGVRRSIAMNRPYEELIDPEILKSTWKRIVEAADRHYIPGEFTTFPAYEWTSSIGVLSSLLSSSPYAQNLHRNVIFKGGKVSGLPFSSFESQNPEDLWEWMELQRKHDIELLAIPHNANISDGRMYAMSTFDGDDINLSYAQKRMRNEPINEVAQNKGQSMIHPELAPNDEFADFEVYQFSLGTGDPRRESKVDGSFVRQAYKNGLKLEKEVGGNPFQFGIIGSTDSHNSASNVEENNAMGKSGTKDPTPEFRITDMESGPRHRRSSVGGLAGVWAKENTREAIFESMESKEVFATSGTRMKVRFFASWDFDTLSFAQPDWVTTAYERGVPMGSTLQKQNSNYNTAPSFAIWAIKDAEGANLDRVQVIKGWLDQDGNTQEKIYDVSWSDNRIKNQNGGLPAVGNTVDINTATYTNDIGAVKLETIWIDPDFDASSSAFYYLRVLEIPTPRWTTYDAIKIGVAPPDDVPATLQERAWSSPIWYQGVD